MTALADGFDWVIPCDADEWWYSAFDSLKNVVRRHDKSAYDVVKAELFDHIPTSDDGPGDTNPYRRIGWRFAHPGRLPKVAVRLRPDLTIGMGNHSASFLESFRVRDDVGLSLRHFTWRSEEQYVRKIRNGWEAYAATDYPIDIGGHWKAFGPPDEPTWEERVRWHYRTWFFAPDPPTPPDRTGSNLVYDPVV